MHFPELERRERALAALGRMHATWSGNTVTQSSTPLHKTGSFFSSMVPRAWKVKNRPRGTEKSSQRTEDVSAS